MEGVEDRLQELPLAVVEVPFAREQPFAEQALGLLRRLPLHELAVVGDQDAEDVLRIAHHVDVVAEKPHV